MPPPLLLGLEDIDLSRDVLTRDDIYEILPHRHEFQLLDGVLHLDKEERMMIAYRDIRDDDWWVKGHVPGRPLLPGVLMLEMAAQASAFLVKKISGFEGFIGFGGIDNCKFREAVQPGCRLLLLVHATDVRSRRIVSITQGVIDGRLVVEADVTGMAMR